MARKTSRGMSGGAPGPVPPGRVQRLRSVVYQLVIAGSLLTVFILLSVRFRFTGDWDGIYVLRGGKGYLLEISDSAFLGEYQKVLFGIAFRSGAGGPADGGEGPWPRMRYTWTERAGNGFIRSFYEDGTQFLVCLGRYLDDSQTAPRGLFVGGGLPAGLYDMGKPLENQTGMAFFDGREWRHLWCNVNESIGPGLDPRINIFPTSWTYLGSRVLRASSREVILASSHEIEIWGQPLRIGRYVFYHAGDRYITLAVKITNVGQQTTSYFYIYGDEPWVGHYGTSMGNVGWHRDGLVMHEAALDPNIHHFAGYWDRGNPACPPHPAQYTGFANFIEWGGDYPPGVVYFSNAAGRHAPAEQMVPLCDPVNRVIFLQYGPRIINPRQTDLLIFHIGMARTQPGDPLPTKPDISFNPDDYSFLRHGAAEVFTAD